MPQQFFSLRIACLTVCLFAASAQLGAALTIESDDFVDEIERLKDLAFGTGSNLYVAPTPLEQTQFAALAASVLAGNVGAADVQAAALDYELVQFTDTVSGNVYLGVRENLVANQQTRGWGSYFVNASYLSDTLIEITHPLFDTRSWEIGALVFRNGESRGFLMAGAHRNANGLGSADVAHKTDTIFHTVHEVFNGAGGQTPAWQIHGFNDANHAFPNPTDAVLSHGDGSITPAVIEVDGNLTGKGFVSYAYNQLPAGDPLNVLVNNGVDGTTFTSLAATTNVQGIHSRALGGDFVHIELEQSIRFDAGNRLLAADAIASALPLNSGVPEPSTAMLAVGLVVLATRRLKRVRVR